MSNIFSNFFENKKFKQSESLCSLATLVIFDLDKENKIIGLEMFNASKVFGIPKAFLKNIGSGKLEVVISKQYIIVNIQIKTKVRNSDRVNSLSIERVRPEFVNQAELHLAIA